jgi:hypothetical protein
MCMHESYGNALLILGAYAPDTGKDILKYKKI